MATARTNQKFREGVPPTPQAHPEELAATTPGVPLPPAPVESLPPADPPVAPAAPMFGEGVAGSGTMVSVVPSESIPAAKSNAAFSEVWPSLDPHDPFAAHRSR